jgi:ABC-type polysaccharide/polyol phosphate export permease
LAATPAAPRPYAAQRAARRAVDVVLALVTSDLRLRYGRGIARGIKWLLDPFAAVGVYLLLVAFVLNRPGQAPGLSVACAVVPFQLVMMGIINALGAVHIRQSIIANMAFPRMLLPIASTVTESLAFFASLLLLPAMMVAYGVAPTWAILWLPVLLVATWAFATGWAYPAALLGLWFPQLYTFVLSAVRAFFFLASGLVALNQVHGRAHTLLPLNPLTGLFEAYRAVFLEGHSPAAWQLLYPLGVAAAAFAVFVPIYRREQVHFAKISEAAAVR